MTSRRLVLLFFLLALIAGECLEFLFFLLSLSCRHYGRRGVLCGVKRVDQLIGKDGKGRE